MTFSADDIPHSIASVTAAQFVGRHHVADGYFFDGRGDAYAAFFTAAPAATPLWTSADTRHAVFPIDDPAFRVPPTARPTDPDFTAPDPVVLRCNGRTVGFYFAGMAWIDPEHRGRGLSTMMILAACVAAGGPVYDTAATMGFTPAGHAAHKAAHREAVRIAAGAAA